MKYNIYIYIYEIKTIKHGYDTIQNILKVALNIYIILYKTIQHIHPSIYLSACLPVCLSIYQSIYPSIYLHPLIVYYTVRTGKSPWRVIELNGHCQSHTLQFRVNLIHIPNFEVKSQSITIKSQKIKRKILIKSPQKRQSMRHNHR